MTTSDWNLEVPNFSNRSLIFVVLPIFACVKLFFKFKICIVPVIISINRNNGIGYLGQKQADGIQGKERNYSRLASDLAGHLN